MRILFVITARGGSKGVPRKNIREIAGLPLIAYKIIAAKKCKYANRIILSTDDNEIADIAREYGADVPFIRPDYLASDTASSMDVIEHAMKWIEVNDESKYDYVCMLEPSSPFTSYIDLDYALDKMIDNNVDTLLGMKEVDVNTAFIHSLDKNGKLSKFYEAIVEIKSVRRQDQEKEYTMNGCMYIAKWDYFKENKLFHSANSIPYFMSEEASIEIDSELNFEVAKFYAENNMINLELWK